MTQYSHNPETDEHITLSMMTVSSSPTIEDIVGKARGFVDNLMLSMSSEGIYKSMGVQPDKIFLLYGPPGTGKTICIEALHNTLNKELYAETNKTNTINIDKIKLYTFQYDIGKFGTAYINIGARRVQSFFDQVGMYTKYGKKTLIVLDEADSLLGKRGDIRSHAEDKKVLETIMKNLQTVHDTPNMYVVMMTNLIEICDEASLRAGRVDKRFKFELPNKTERSLSFKKAADKFNTKAGYQVVRGINEEVLASKSAGLSYADIFQVVESAIRERALELSKVRVENIIPAGYIHQKRLEDMLDKHTIQFHPPKKVIGF